MRKEVSTGAYWIYDGMAVVWAMPIKKSTWKELTETFLEAATLWKTLFLLILWFLKINKLQLADICICHVQIKYIKVTFDNISEIYLNYFSNIIMKELLI